MGNKISGRIRNFWRLRKQSDTMKIICLFALTGAVFLICTVYHTWEIYQYVNTPAEYILAGEGAVSNQRIDELLRSKDVSAVSRQMEIPVSVQYEGAETVVECTMLSKEYLEEISGMGISEGSSRIYMNEAAFSEFQEAIREDRENMAPGEGAESVKGGLGLDVYYSAGEDALAVSGDGSDNEDGAGTAAQNYRSAKLMVVKTGGEEAESFIYITDTDRQLLREAAGLRVQFKKHDLDGIHVESLRKLGYGIVNEGAIMAEEYELQMKLLHIRYGLVICGICIVGVEILNHLSYNDIQE